MVAKFRWRSSDLDLLPNDGKRYEIIDGELLVTHAPHWGHQKACGRIFSALDNWSIEVNSGESAVGPGVLFTEADNVIPDVVWTSSARISTVLDESGHLTAAPDLAVEVLSLGSDNQRRDRQLKLRLYSAQGVREYWLIDWRLKTVEIYRREQAQLVLQATLLEEDTLDSPMLLGFSYPLRRLFA